MAQPARPLRVVFIEQEAKLGGVEMTTLITAAGLNRRDFEPLVICPESGELVTRLEKAGVPCLIKPRPAFLDMALRVGDRYLPNPVSLLINPLQLWRAARRTARSLRELKADIVVTKGLLAHFYGGMAAGQVEIPCLWHMQEVTSNALDGLYRCVLNAAARRFAGLIIVDARSVGEQFAPDLHRQGKIRLLYNGIDTGRFSPQGNRAAFPFEASFIIGQVGRVIPLKGQHVLLDAFRRIADTCPQAHLIFVGVPLFDTDAYLNTLQQQAKEWGLSERVHFPGFRADIPDLLRAMDIFVHPSIEADSPVSLQEAMSSGGAVIASEVPGMAELVTQGEDGYLVTAGDAAALARQLVYLITHPAERARLAEAARQTALTRFDQSLYLEQFEQIIRQVVAKGP